MMIGEETQGVVAAGASPEMMTITEEAVTAVHGLDLEIGTVGNVNLVTLLPEIHVISVMHPKMIIFLTQTEE